jgi:acyl-CoA thioesterase-1
MADSGHIGAMKSLVHSLTFAALALAGLVGMFATPALAQRDTSLKIVAFGDSLTAGYGLPVQDAFPAKLEAALKARGHKVEIENAGVSGDTASGGLSRLDWSVGDGTEAVILELGANDMLRGVDPALVEQNLDTMLGRLNQRNIPVLLAGMVAAPNLGHAYAEAFGTIYPRLAEKYGVPLYPFFLDGVAGDRDFLLQDGMHPNAEGIDRMVERVLPLVERIIEEADA